MRSNSGHIEGMIAPHRLLTKKTSSRIGGLNDQDGETEKDNLSGKINYSRPSKMLIKALLIIDEKERITADKVIK